MINISKFGEYDKYTLSSDVLSVDVITLGATVTSLRFEGFETVPAYESPEGYLSGNAYICAAIGRYGNRIGGARFVMNDREYKLSPNENSNQLHGGPDSWDKRPWTAEVLGESSVRMSIFSPDGDNGFPGDMRASFVYTVEGAALRIDFEGQSESDTVYAPTSHMYFNLDGSDSILSHELMINAGAVLEVDDELIPTGKLLPAEAYFDFSTLRPVKNDYDHAFVLKGSHACTLQAGGISMRLDTDMPALQVYTSQGLGEPFGKYKAIAIEPECFPDSPNHPHFPSTLLKKGERFHRWASFSFSRI